MIILSVICIYRHDLLYIIMFSTEHIVFSILFIIQGCLSTVNSTKLVENPIVNSQQTATTEKVVSEAKIKSPRLMFETSTFDFGKVKPSSENTAVFSYTNVGDKPLKIKNLHKCCGAAVTLDKEQLAPGETGTLTAKYSVGKGTGVFTRAISFSTNDPQKQQMNFTIKGEVTQTLQWSPDTLELASYGKDIKSPEITIKSLNDTPFAIKSFNSTKDCFKADYDPNSKAKEFVLKPAVNADKVKRANFQ
jgi:hypothetical protein